MNATGNPKDALIGFVILLTIAVLALLFYFLPTFIAFRRGHSNRLPLLLVNGFFGWTFLGWMLCLVWSLTSNTDSRHERLAYRA